MKITTPVNYRQGNGGDPIFSVSALSGSVPRTRNKQSGLFAPCVPGHGAGRKHNIWYEMHLTEALDVVFLRRRAPGRVPEIRVCWFSDLTGEEEILYVGFVLYELYV